MAQQAQPLLRAAGGPERLYELSGATSLVELWVRLTEQEGQERRRLAEDERKLKVAADDPALIVTAEQLLAQQPPHKLTPILARSARSLPETPDERTARRVRQVEAIQAVADEDRQIREALRQTGGNQAAAARLLGKAPSTVQSWLRRRAPG